MTRTRKEIEKGLLNKGFVKVDTHHHRFIYQTITNERTAVFTKTSHSHTDLSNDMIGQMARQCRLSRKQFDALIDCSLTREAYEEQLRQENAIRD